MRILFLCFAACLFGESSIVFIHLGTEIPDYLPTAITQARLFNRSCPIYLIANRAALKDHPQELDQNHTICVEAESLPRDPLHETFSRMTRLDRKSRGGFWLYATERFFYLHSLMKKFALTDVFHLEYDNMLYADVERLVPSLRKYYSDKIGGTFDNDSRCIGGIMYVSNPVPMQKFLQFIVQKVWSTNNDMEFLAQFKSVDGGAWIDHLPIVPPNYLNDHPLVSPYRHTTNTPALYFNHFDEIQGVFDAAALGQFLGGIDPRNAPSVPGFINESCLFNPSLFEYEWIADQEGRLVPWIVYGQEKYRIINLHIHCKNLKKFASWRNQP